MASAQDSREFVEASRPALEHLFNMFAEQMQTATEQLEELQRQGDLVDAEFLNDLQYSDQANQFHAQWLHRRQHLGHLQRIMTARPLSWHRPSTAKIDATMTSIGVIAGAILQVAKQALSYRWGSKKGALVVTSARSIFSQSIIEVIWEGRNHAMHWEDGPGRKPVKDMLAALEADSGWLLPSGDNHAPLLLDALGWHSADVAINDLLELVDR